MAKKATALAEDFFPASAVVVVQAAATGQDFQTNQDGETDLQAVMVMDQAEDYAMTKTQKINQVTFEEAK